MKKSRVVLFTALIALYTNSNAQPTYFEGPVFTEDGRTFKKFLSFSEDGFYVLRKGREKKKDKYFFDKFDQNTLTLSSSSEINLSIDGTLKLEHYKPFLYTFKKDKSVFLFYSAVTKNDSANLYLSILQPDNLSAGVPFKIAGAKSEYSFYSIINNSPDFSKTLVIIFDSDGSAQATVMDNNSLKIMYKQKLEKKKGRHTFDDKFLIDNEGNVFYTAPDGSELDKDPYNTFIFSYSPAKNQFKNHELKTPAGKFIETFVLKCLSDNKVVFSSILEDQRKGEKAIPRNAYFQNIIFSSSSLDIAAESVTPFDKGLVNTFSDGELLPGNTHYDDIDIIEDKGHFWLMFEHSFSYREIITSTNSSGSTTGHRTQTTNEYRDIIVVQGNVADSKINWMKALPRSATYETQYFNYILFGNSLHLVYPDNPKNFEKFTPENHNSYDVKSYVILQETNIVQYSISSSGSISRSVVYEKNTKRHHYILPLKENMILNSNTLLFNMISERKENKFSKLTF